MRVQKILEAAGGRSAVRGRLGLSRNSVYRWVLRAKVPKKHSSTLARMTKGQYTAKQIREAGGINDSSD